MDTITFAIKQFLKPGPAIFVPIFILIFVFVLKLITKKSISWIDGIKSALTLGIAFVAMSMVIGFIVNVIEPAFNNLSKSFNFNTVDLGWAPMSAISWAWPYAFILFPVQIFINVIMLKFKLTKTFNADLWNVWNKVLIAVLIAFFIPGVLGIVVGIVFGAIQVVFELKNADVMYEQFYKLTKIPNVVSPHSMFLHAPFVFFIDKFLQKIPFFRNGYKLKRKMSVKKKKIVKLIRENMIIGFFLGAMISLMTVWSDMANWDKYILLPIEVAAGLVLFPLVAKFFTKSLVPIGVGVQNMMQEKFKDRELYVGLDWPFIAGNQKLWIAASIWVPITLGYSMLLQYAGMTVFPLAGIMNICLAAVVTIICDGNLRRMVFTGIILTPMYLYFGTWAAAGITDLANNVNNISPQIKEYIDNGYKISWSGFESPGFRFGMINLARLVTGQFGLFPILGSCAFIFWLVLFILYYFQMKKRSAKYKEERLELERQDKEKIEARESELINNSAKTEKQLI